MPSSGVSLLGSFSCITIVLQPGDQRFGNRFPAVLPPPTILRLSHSIPSCVMKQMNKKNCWETRSNTPIGLVLGSTAHLMKRVCHTPSSKASIFNLRLACMQSGARGDVASSQLASSCARRRTGRASRRQGGLRKIMPRDTRAIPMHRALPGRGVHETWVLFPCLRLEDYECATADAGQIRVHACIIDGTPERCLACAYGSCAGEEPILRLRQSEKERRSVSSSLRRTAVAAALQRVKGVARYELLCSGRCRRRATWSGERAAGDGQRIAGSERRARDLRNRGTCDVEGRAACLRGARKVVLLVAAALVTRVAKGVGERVLRVVRERRLRARARVVSERRLWARVRVVRERRLRARAVGKRRLGARAGSEPVWAYACAAAAGAAAPE
ncbi:hypothetical protein GGX14DRAFT_542213 [Mycena pura]|uniref:Uncharacterized protein n=1 Tax=Mycena pura TaxID=153505 RepID=A0AAD6VJF0_9AGAR|nr:hypothetical protein GGX14DRAFT_542213 [Mycena pura]